MTYKTPLLTELYPGLEVEINNAKGIVHIMNKDVDGRLTGFHTVDTGDNDWRKENLTAEQIETIKERMERDPLEFSAEMKTKIRIPAI